MLTFRCFHNLKFRSQNVNEHGKFKCLSHEKPFSIKQSSHDDFIETLNILRFLIVLSYSTKITKTGDKHKEQKMIPQKNAIVLRRRRDTFFLIIRQKLYQVRIRCRNKTKTKKINYKYGRKKYYSLTNNDNDALVTISKSNNNNNKKQDDNIDDSCSSNSSSSSSNGICDVPFEVIYYDDDDDINSFISFLTEHPIIQAKSKSKSLFSGVIGDFDDNIIVMSSNNVDNYKVNNVDDMNEKKRKDGIVILEYESVLDERNNGNNNSIVSSSSSSSSTDIVNSNDDNSIIKLELLLPNTKKASLKSYWNEIIIYPTIIIRAVLTIANMHNVIMMILLLLFASCNDDAQQYQYLRYLSHSSSESITVTSTTTTTTAYNHYYYLSPKHIKQIFDENVNTM